MNWRASLFGALVVALAGLAVGVVVGGKKTVETVTVTVARTITPPPSTITTTPDPTTTLTSETVPPATTTVGDGADDGATQQYLTDYLTRQGSDALNEEASYVSLIDDPSDLQLKGRTYQHAVAFRLLNYGDSLSFQMPIAGFRRVSSSIIGLDTLSSARARFRLAIYKDHADTPNATILFRETFHGPSGTHALDFDTQGATVLVFEWTKTADEPDSENDFILADPVITR